MILHPIRGFISKIHVPLAQNQHQVWLSSAIFKSKVNVFQQSQQRNLFTHWIDSVSNKISRERIEEVGPDRACAEWLLRNGAFVQWTNCKEFVKDYNHLPLQGDGKGHFFIKSVDATDSSVMAIGFPHFEGCKHIENIIFKRCSYVDDDALPQLAVLKNSLRTLKILLCWNVTSTGLLSLTSLSNLQNLELGGLSEVKNKGEVKQKLQAALPNCNIIFDDVQKDKEVK